MANKNGNPQNLIPNSKRTPEELRQMTHNGGVKSGKVRRERKLLSQIYADILAKLYEGEENSTLVDVVKSIVERGDAASVSILKEMREATEGNKVDIGGEGIRIIYQVADDRSPDSSQ